MSIITCRDLCIGYDKKILIKDINLEIKEGDYISVVGPNGAGKSTLAKTLIKQIKTISGEITYNNEVLKTHIGYLSQQNVDSNDFPASVYEVIRSGCINQLGFRAFFKKNKIEHVNRIIDFLELNHLKKRCYRELSGGQKRLVLLARALCAANKILVLDEPVAGLDPIICANFYEIVKRANAHLGISILMVSHDLQNVVKYSKRVLHIDKKIKFYGTTEDYVKSKVYAKFNTEESNRD